MTVTQRWACIYTAGLPEQVRRDRYEELASDLHEQLADAGGTPAARRAARREVVGRTVRGAVDDLIWRREVGRAMSSKSLRAVVSQAWWAPVAVLVLVFDVGLAAFILADEQSTMPGRVAGPALILVAALAMGVGLAVRLDLPAVPGARGGRAAAVAGAAVIAMAALAVAGVGGPAVLLAAGLVAVVAVAVVARRTVRSAAAADGLVLLGTLPALMMFWLIVPALLALVVIVGVLTSHPRAVPTPA